MIRSVLLSRRSLLALALLTPALALYYGFSFYLSSVGSELLGSWLRAEAVEIQEGNLLTSISKNQRVLFSSRYVQGITLVDTSDGTRLIEMGAPVEVPNGKSVAIGQVAAIGAGFLHKQIVYRPPSRPDTLLIFDVESSFLQTIFYCTLAALVFFIFVLLGSIRHVEAREAHRRETYLKNALQDFIEKDTPSAFIEGELPSVVNWWKDQKARIEKSKQQKIRAERITALAEMGARIAHDIRAPLATIRGIASTLQGVPTEEADLLNRAIQRIRDIANEVGDENRARFLLDRPQERKADRELPKVETLVLSVVLEQIIAEKRIQHLSSNLEIIGNFTSSGRFSCVTVDSLEFRRAISNLIDNGVEALGPGGRVLVNLDASENSVLLAIHDNGRGIPAELIAKVGELGFSFGKEKGSGLGVHYARQAILSWNGTLRIQSGSGTSVEITLPRVSAPWLRTELVLKPNATLAGLDDDSAVHVQLQSRLSALHLPDAFESEHFFAAEDFIRWFRDLRDTKRDLVLLSDQYIGADGMLGLDVIETLNIAGQATLVTTALDDPKVVERCKLLGVSLLPKSLLPFVPIRFA